MSTANVKAVITAEDRASNVISGVGASFGKLASAFAVGQLAANVVASAFDKLVSVGKQAVGMAFDQVRSVENASFALRAYEKDTNKVNKVLSELVSFARSDMGVLFQREELFKAASNLRAFGVASDEITGKVKVLARGVSLGMTSFDELSQIIGRVVQKGRLDANEFDMLAQRGIVLDSKFRGLKVTSQELFTELERVLPANLLEGRANTIDGAMIRLKSSLRNLGAAFLGVDKDTSKFIKGGLGDRAMEALNKLRNTMSSASLVSAIRNFSDWLIKLGESMADIGKSVGDYLAPKFQVLGDTIKEHTPTFIRLWQEVLSPLAHVAGEVLVGAFGLLVDATNILMTVMAPMVNWMLDHKETVVAFATAFGTLYASIKIWDAIDKMRVGFETLKLVTIPNLMTSLQGFITFATGAGGFALVGAVAAGAAILVANEWRKAWDAVNQTNNAIDSMKRSNNDAVSLIKKSMQEGKISVEEGQKKIKSLEGDMNSVNKNSFWNNLKNVPSNFWRGLTGRAIGGPVSNNTPYVVGERGPELFVPNSSGRIIPNNNMPSMGSSSVNINVSFSGVFTGNEMEFRKLATKVFSAYQDAQGMRGA